MKKLNHVANFIISNNKAIMIISYDRHAKYDINFVSYIDHEYRVLDLYENIKKVHVYIDFRPIKGDKYSSNAKNIENFIIGVFIGINIGYLHGKHLRYVHWSNQFEDDESNKKIEESIKFQSDISGIPIIYPNTDIYSSGACQEYTRNYLVLHYTKHKLVFQCNKSIKHEMGFSIYDKYEYFPINNTVSEIGYKKYNYENKPQ